MLSVQSVLGFILGFAVAAIILVLCAPLAWRRALFLAQKVVRTELPLSLKEVEADRDFLRARQAVTVCRLQEELIREQQDDHSRKLALSKAREKLHYAGALEMQYKAQQAELENKDKKILGLEEQNSKLKRKANESLKLKQADLVQFRRQIKAIAAQTAGFIAAAEGEESPILHIAAVEVEKAAAAANDGKFAKRGAGQGQDKNLAAAIYQQARQALALRKVKKDSAREVKKSQAAVRTAAETAAQALAVNIMPAAERIIPAPVQEEAKETALKKAKPGKSAVKAVKTAAISKSRAKKAAETAITAAESRENS